MTNTSNQENELAEELLIAISKLKDAEGRYLGVRLSFDPMDNIRMAKEVAADLVSQGWKRE